MTRKVSDSQSDRALGRCNPGIQIALLGGIGCGKTTTLLLAEAEMRVRRADAENFLRDVSEDIDLDKMCPGALLTIIGSRLWRVRKGMETKNPAGVETTYSRLIQLTGGVTDLLPRQFAPLHQHLTELTDIVASLAEPLVTAGRRLTMMVDGLTACPRINSSAAWSRIFRPFAVRGSPLFWPCRLLSGLTRAISCLESLMKSSTFPPRSQTLPSLTFFSRYW